MPKPMRGKIHFWTRQVQAEGRVVRCGLRIIDTRKTTTATGAVTCQRCRNFLATDAGGVTRESRRRRARAGMY